MPQYRRAARLAVCALRPLVGLLALLISLSAAPVRADQVLTFKYTPAARAQIAIWLEDASGKFLATVALTESVGFRGIGNRPGASNMNSGYRWPYGRREGVLPIWAHRRASAPGAKRFPRVIFQNRVEGLASRTTNDQSPDRYYCLQFDQAKATKDNLDAVSCATMFSSDKGRYMTAGDVAAQYAEPFEPTPGEGMRQVLPLDSLYPPRMDIARCTDAACYDHADVAHYAEDARAVMPEIDAITIATPPGEQPARVLFSVPNDWPSGSYTAFIEVSLEGDYNASWNETKYPTPRNPSTDWDYYALTYGYAYRGQPSIVWKVPFTLAAGSEVEAAATQPAGRSSWDYWNGEYGELETPSFDAGDPNALSMAVADSGAQRLRADASGRAFTVASISDDTTGPSTPPPAAGAGAPDDGPSTPEMPSSAGASAPPPQPGAAGGKAVPLDPGATSPGTNPGGGAQPAAAGKVGAVGDLSLLHYPERLRAHTWIRLRMRAASSAQPLHAYEVRVSLDPISDESTFIRNGRQAKDATDSAEGATLLTLPTDVPAGDWIEASIGDLSADTHYYVGVRATDALNRHGPLEVAEITTMTREFATVSACFVATAAYGSPLAAEVNVLRRIRDRYLSPQLIGRAWVQSYYRYGARAAAWIAPHPWLRSAVRHALSPLVALARMLP